MAVAADALTLDFVNNNIATVMQKSESSLTSTLKGLGDGSTASVTQLVGLQYLMSVYSITGQTISAVMKECSDTMKSVVQEI